MVKYNDIDLTLNKTEHQAQPMKEFVFSLPSWVYKNWFKFIVNMETIQLFHDKSKKNSRPNSKIDAFITKAFL